jgi:hypothetical protein
MHKKLLVAICFSILISGFILFHCKLPEAPAGPEEAKISLLFKSSDGKLDEAGSITDSVGKEVQIGIALHLTQYIDSSLVRVSLDGVTERTFPWRFKDKMDDTVFFPITFTKTGTRLIEATAYITDQLNSVAKGKIIVLGPPSLNHAPQWTVKNIQRTIMAGVRFLYDLSSYCADPDNDSLTFSLISELPANDSIIGTTYSFTPSISDTGKYPIRILARDPIGLEDTLTLELTVSNTSVDTKPPVIKRVSPADSITVSSSSIQITVSCKDESGIDSVGCFIGTAAFNLTKSIDSIYSATVTGLQTSVWNTISVVARDASPAKNLCTLLVHLKYDNTAPDNVPPVITFLAPSKDTVIGVDSFEVKVTCADDSSISSVKGFRDGSTFTLKKSASVKNLWTGMAKGFAAGSYSTIKIVAEDSSKAKNRDSALVRIKYDNDKSGPVITLINPEKDSVTISSSSYMIVLKATDASGVLSINGATGASTFTGVRDTSSVWKINVNALENYKVTAIVLTATDSSLKVNKTLDTIYIRSEIVNGFKITFDKNDNAATGTMAELTINSGDSAKLSTNAFVKDGSMFSGWMTTPTGTVAYVDGAMFKMGTSSVTLYAKWIKKASYALTITAVNGSVTKSPNAVTYDSGTVVSLTPIPSNNYHFSGWSGALTGTTNPATITMNSDKSVTAGFEVNPPNTFSLTVTASNGAVKKTPDLPQYDSGSTVGLKAIANTGYKFVDWSGDATGTSDSTAVVINKGKSVTANFALIPYQLTVAAVNGTVTLPATLQMTVNHGVLTSIKAVANTGYSFSNWVVTSGTATITSASAESTTVSLTSGDAKVTANFTVIPVTLTLTNDGHGATTPASTASGSYGVPITISAAASDGYSFSGWTKTTGSAVFGNEAQENTTVTLTTNATIRANFTAIPVTLTLTNDGHGTTTPASTASGSYGVPITISAAASSGYSFSGWTTTAGTAVFGNASQVSTTVTLTTVNATIRANFTPNLLRPINVAATSPVCSGSASTLTASIPSNGTGTLTWYRGSCGGGTAVGTGTSVSSGTLTSDATFYVRAEVGGNYSECASVNVAVNQLPTKPTPVTRLVTICPGSSITLSTTSNPPSEVTWQWYTTKTPASSSQALGSLNVTPTSTSTFYVRGETGTCGNSAWDSTRVVVRSVSSVSSITADPSDTICEGSSVTLTVNGVLGDGATWHWYSGSCGGVPEGTGSSITKKISSSMLFYVRAEGGCNQTGCVFKQISRKYVPIITGTQGFTRVDDISGSTYRLYVNATPTTQTDELYYQWYKNDVPMTGYNSNMTYVSLPVGVGIWYCAVTSGETGCTVKAEPCSLFVSNP